MNMALHHPLHRSAEAAPLDRVRVFDDMAAVEPVWRRFEAAADSLMSPYQRFDFLAAWQRHVGSRRGVTPLIAVGFDAAGGPLCLWPLGRSTGGGIRKAEFLGGKHANFNTVIWQRDFARQATAATIEGLIGQFAPAVDLLVLLNQPEHWEGIANPLALLPHGVSPSSAYSGKLMPDFDALQEARISGNKRRKLRNRERQLNKLGPLHLRRPQSAEDARAMLAVFHEQKAQHMREIGVDNVFTKPGVADFIEEAACANFENGPALEIYALSVGDRIVATSAGVPAHGRFSNMFNSIARDETAQGSPGASLLIRLVQDLCGRGLHTFDLGVGDAQYKDLFCPDEEVLFDSFLPLSPVGRMFAAATRAAYAAKRTIKKTPALWSAVQAARSLRKRLTPPIS
jgi:CelD/BcsL family acetyltransferase involved in cellulose biosynthesis